MVQNVAGSIHLSINPTVNKYLYTGMSSAWLEMLGYGAECGWFYPSFYQPNSKQVPVLCQVLGGRCLVMVQNVAGSIHLSINPTVNKYLYYVKCLVGDAWLWCRMLLVLSIFLSTQQ